MVESAKTDENSIKDLFTWRQLILLKGSKWFNFCSNQDSLIARTNGTFGKIGCTIFCIPSLAPRKGMPFSSVFCCPEIWIARQVNKRKSEKSIGS